MSDTTDATDTEVSTDDRRTAVRERYADVASENVRADGADGDDGDCCTSSCCGDDGLDGARDEAAERSLEVGYEEGDLATAPEGANLGLGCGNPVALSRLEPGETVLDLGSGGGFDCFLAAEEVGPEGRVIGVDMTPEMVERARENAAESDHENVEFRLGEIEHLPAADGVADAVISNCVINLSPEKGQVLAEAFRALRPGGRLAISDLVATEPLPERVRNDPDLVAGCVGGAATIDGIEARLEGAGFVDVEIVVGDEWDGEFGGESLPIVSARIEARKPAD